MDWGLFLGFLVTLGVFLLVWFGLVVPSVRRDHQRRLELIRKRLREHENRSRGPSADQSTARIEREDG